MESKHLAGTRRQGKGLHQPHPEFQNLPSSSVALIGQGSRGPSQSSRGWGHSAALDTRSRGHLGSHKHSSSRGCVDTAWSCLLSGCWIWDAQKPPKRKPPTPPLDLCFPNQNQSRNCYQSVQGTVLDPAHQGWHFHTLLEGSAPANPSLPSARVPALVTHLHPQPLSHK